MDHTCELRSALPFATASKSCNKFAPFEILGWSMLQRSYWLIRTSNACERTMTTPIIWNLIKIGKRVLGHS